MMIHISPTGRSEMHTKFEMKPEEINGRTRKRWEQH
jgi:hypothetical protein